MLTALGIAGSPRRRGNSTTLLKAVLEGAEAKGAHSDIIYLDDLAYRGCKGCDKCTPGGRCIIKDALTPVFSALKLADIWVLASPVYYDGFTGQIKTFFDRCRQLTYNDGNRSPQLIGNRSASVILTYADSPRDDYLEIAQRQVNYLSWMGNFTGFEIISAGNLWEPDEAAQQPELLDNARRVGEKLVKYL